MYNVSSKFMDNLKTYGRMITTIISDDKSTYKDSDVISVNKSFNTDICKSTMQTVNIELKGNIKIVGELNIVFGVGTQEEPYEYLDFGNFIVDQYEYVVENDSTKITAYDYMYKSHSDFESDRIVYPCTIYELVKKLCEYVEIPFKQGIFNNGDKVIESNVFANSVATYRDLFDFVAQATGLNIFIKNNALVLKECYQTNVTVDEHNLSSLALEEKYGPINSLVLSRSEGADTIYRNDESSIIDNGLCEIKISDNPILNAMNRNDYIDNLFSMFNGMNYKIFNLESFGCMIFEPGDIFTLIDLEGNEYKTMCLNSTITINTGVNEKIYTELPEVSKTDYSSSTKDERKDKTTYLQVNKEIGEIKSYVEETSNSIYKFETGHGNIFDDCNQMLQKDISDIGEVSLSNMPLGINKDYMQGKDICISTFIRVTGGIIGVYGNYIGAEFEVGYADGTKKLYSTRWYLGQYSLQYLLQTSTVDHEERIWAHFKIEDKEITSVSNLKMIIAFDCEKAIVANPKVEFGTFPTGFEFDVNYIRDNVETIQKDYTEIKQDVGSLSLKAVSMEEQITTIKGDVNSVTTRIQSAEIKLEPTNILLAVNEKIGIDGKLYTTKFVLDKNGVHISGGGLDIKNNAGTKVFYADGNGNLTINNLTATNGKFTGSISGSSITGSTITGGSITSNTNIDVNTDLRVGNNIYIGSYADRDTKKYIYLNDRFAIASRNSVLAFGVENGDLYKGKLYVTSSGGVIMNSGIAQVTVGSQDASIFCNSTCSIVVGKSNIDLTPAGGYVNIGSSVILGNVKFLSGKKTNGEPIPMICRGDDNNAYVGYGNYGTVIRGAWCKLGSSSGATITSDKNLKRDIFDISKKYENFFMGLKPVSYKYCTNNHKRDHIGFIAQKVEEAMNDVGLTSEQFAGLCVDEVKDYEVLTEDDDMKYLANKGISKIYSLRYEEFIALNTHMIQNNILNIKNLEQRISELEKRINTN